MFERARVVIGADGRNSRVAKAVQPHQYHDKPMLQWSYYTYWSDLPVDGFEIVIRPDRGFAAIATNDGLTMLVVGWPDAEADAYKADVEANYLKTLDLAPEFAERVRGAKREARFSGGIRPQLLPQAIRSRVGARRRRRLHQGSDHGAGDHRRVPRCRAVLRRSLRGVQRRAFVRGRDGATTTRHATHACCRSTSSPRNWRRSKPRRRRCSSCSARCTAIAKRWTRSSSITAGTVSPVEFFDPENIGRLMGAVRV